MLLSFSNALRTALWFSEFELTRFFWTVPITAASGSQEAAKNSDKPPSTWLRCPARTDRCFSLPQIQLFHYLEMPASTSLLLVLEKACVCDQKPFCLGFCLRSPKSREIANTRINPPPTATSIARRTKDSFPAKIFPIFDSHVRRFSTRN